MPADMPQDIVSAIEVNDLTKVYRVAVRGNGLGESVKSLIKRKYEERVAVDKISFKVRHGEVVAFVGPNGAGKTTTLKILSGIIRPTDGDARVLGCVPWERRRGFQKRIAMVMGQKAQLWWDLPAQDSFLLQKEIYGIPDALYKSHLSEWVDRLSVSDALQTPLRLLSLGQRMKMELIGALLHEPEVLFLDEPTIGLDLLSQEAIHKFLLELKARGKTTILLTSHYVKDVQVLCDRVIAIREAKIVFEGSLSQLSNSGDLELTLREIYTASH